MRLKIFLKSILFFSLFFCLNSNAAEQTRKNFTNSQDQFSTSTKGLPFVKNPEVVFLKNGDTYTLIASVVKQKIGNTIIRRYAYNGSIPGPILNVPQGAKINIKFINKTDCDQTIHSHGLRLDYRFDGAVGMGQKTAVKPNETFVYTLYFPDAGLFWYHPHVREDYTQNMGLYGNYIVRPQKNNFYEPVNQETLFTLADVLIGTKDALFYKSHTTHATMGRYGNVILVNGKELFSQEANQGDVVRFLVTNTANTRTFNFKIPHAKMKIIAGDASTFEQEFFAESIIIAPSERYIVDVLFDKPGVYHIQNATPGKTFRLGVVNVSKKKTQKSYAKEFLTLHKDQDLTNEVKKLTPYFEKPVDKNLILSVTTNMEHEDHEADQERNPKIEWNDTMPEMNAMMTSEDVRWEMIDADTKKVNMNIHWKLQKGKYYKIRIFNDPKSDHPMQHPIHFHGQRFLVLTHNGKRTSNFVWKDTVLIPAGDTVEILLEASNPGEWMAHCHISEHLSSNMMMGFSVVN